MIISINKKFQTDWNDGRVANELVRSMGGPAPPPNRLRRDPAKWEENCQMAIDAGKKLGMLFALNNICAILWESFYNCGTLTI